MKFKPHYITFAFKNEAEEIYKVIWKPLTSPEKRNEHLKGAYYTYDVFVINPKGKQIGSWSSGHYANKTNSLSLLNRTLKNQEETYNE